MQTEQSNLPNSGQKFHAQPSLVTPLNRSDFSAKAPQLSEVLSIKYEYSPDCCYFFRYVIFTILSISWIFAFIYYFLFPLVEQQQSLDSLLVAFLIFLTWYLLLKVGLQFCFFVQNQNLQLRSLIFEFGKIFSLLLFSQIIFSFSGRNLLAKLLVHFLIHSIVLGLFSICLQYRALLSSRIRNYSPQNNIQTIEYLSVRRRFSNTKPTEPSLFRFLRNAQRKQQLKELLQTIQQNGTQIQLSQYTRPRNSVESQRQCLSNFKFMNLKLIDSYIQNDAQLESLLQGSGMVFIEFQIRHLSENPQDQIAVSDFLQDYKAEFEARADKHASIYTKYYLGINDECLPFYYYTSYWRITAIKFLVGFLVSIWLFLPFLMLIRCLVKKKKIRIVKKVRVQ